MFATLHQLKFRSLLQFKLKQLKRLLDFGPMTAAAYLDKLKSAFNLKHMNVNARTTMANLITVDKKNDLLDGLSPWWNPKPGYRVFVIIAFAILLSSCAAYGPYHANTSSEPLNSVRGPKDGRYKLAFIEFGDQGSALDTSQRTAALRLIHEADGNGQNR